MEQPHFPQSETQLENNQPCKLEIKTPGLQCHHQARVVAGKVRRGSLRGGTFDLYISRLVIFQLGFVGGTQGMNNGQNSILSLLQAPKALRLARQMH